MGKSDQTQQLLANVSRLRRVQARVGADTDLTVVRSELESELGTTVSRRSAARFLGVSHTTINRWAKRGDLPVVPTPNGTFEISVDGLVALKDRVDENRKKAPENRHLETLVREDSEKADRMRTYRYIPREGNRSGHDRAEMIGIAYHRAISGRVNRATVEEAKYRIYRWMRSGKIDSRYGDMWIGVLNEPISEIRDVITENSSRGNDLRQNSPFAGMLGSRERARLLGAIK